MPATIASSPASTRAKTAGIPPRSSLDTSCPHRHRCSSGWMRCSRRSRNLRRHASSHRGARGRDRGGAAGRGRRRDAPHRGRREPRSEQQRHLARPRLRGGLGRCRPLPARGVRAGPRRAERDGEGRNGRGRRGDRSGLRACRRAAPRPPDPAPQRDVLARDRERPTSLRPQPRCGPGAADGNLRASGNPGRHALLLPGLGLGPAVPGGRVLSLVCRARDRAEPRDAARGRQALPRGPPAPRNRFAIRQLAEADGGSQPARVPGRYGRSRGSAARNQPRAARRPGARQRDHALSKDEVTDPARAGDLERLLRKHRITLKHRLGQNFLVDPGLRDSIADAASSTQDAVLEGGAGVGPLTIALATRCPRLVAVEFDRDLIPALREVVAGLPNVEVVQADILRFDVAGAFPAGGEVVAGNIPYNLTGALIPKLLDQSPRPRLLSLVVQREVAERWTARTAASLSTIAVQVFAEARMVMTIPAAAFTPPPTVDSALVSLDVRPAP